MLGYGIHTAECSVLRYTVQWDIMTVMITVTDQTGLTKHNSVHMDVH